MPFYLMEILHGVVPADEEDPGDLVDARVAVDAHGRDQPRVSLPLRHRHGGRRRRGQRGGGGRPGGRKVQIVLQMGEEFMETWDIRYFNHMYSFDEFETPS